MTKSSHARENLVRCFGPHEGLGVVIGVANVSADGSPERLGTAMDSTAQLFLRQQGKPALHQVEPGRAGRREVHVEARPLEQPPTDQRRFVVP
jgi:hypothetical protein